jgi:hypothetical protein
LELLVFLPMFLAGFGCGFYVRDRILEKRRSRYLVQPIYPPQARPYPELNRYQEIPPLPLEEPNRDQEVAAPQPTKPDNDRDIAALTPLDFNAVRMSEELRALLELLPREGRTKS